MHSSSHANNGMQRDCLAMLAMIGRPVTAAGLLDFMLRQGAETDLAQVQHALAGLRGGAEPRVEIAGTERGPTRRPRNLYQLTERGNAVLAGKPKAPRPSAPRPAAHRVAILDEANLRRQERAAADACARVERALEILGPDVPEHLAAAGRLRLANRQASLEELGQLANPPLTKDAIAGRIRRLLAMADRRASDLGLPSTEASLTMDMLS
jgi:DNA-binding PadR family transcriptional regulator